MKARLVELQAKVAAKVEITIEDMVRQADEDREFARENGHSAAAHAATMGKAKLLGMLVEKSQVDVHHHYDDMTDEELDRELVQALTGGTLTIALDRREELYDHEQPYQPAFRQPNHPRRGR